MCSRWIRGTQDEADKSSAVCLLEWKLVKNLEANLITQTYVIVMFTRFGRHHGNESLGKERTLISMA